MSLNINSLIKTDTEDYLRILYFDALNNVYFVIDVNNSRWPFAINERKIKEGIANNEFFMEESVIENVINSEDMLSESQKEKRDFAWEIVQFLIGKVNEPQLLFYSKYRLKVVRETAAHYQVSNNTVRNYLINYWKNGMTIDALVPNFNNCGGRGKERKANQEKLGRKRKDGSTGINIDESLRRKFKAGLNRHYYTDKQNSLKTAYELTIKDFFTEKEKDTKGNEISILREPKMIPTYNQFRYWFKKMNNVKKEISTRYGTRVYHQKYRSITGDSTQDAGLGPGTLWQTDSTPLDVHCVSFADRSKLVGKPLLHLVIDVYSRVIVGFSLGFESLNAYSGSMNALYNSMTSKQLLCERYQIDIENDEWDVACIPQRIFTDRGELESSQIENAIEHLGISIQASPSYRPETKAIIEQAFLQIMQRVIPHVDGAVVSGNRIRERGEQDYRLKANLTVFELTQILIKCIIFYNNHHVIKDYILDEGMLEAKIDKIPMEIWKYGVENKKGNLRTLSEDYIRLHLYETDSALVTSRGIRFKKMLYINRYTLKNNWFERAREKTWKEKIWFDPTNLSFIYLLNQETNSFMKLKLLDHLTKFERKNIVEIETMIEEENINIKKAEEKEMVEKMKLFDAVDQIVSSGKNETAKVSNPTLSKTQKIKGIRDNHRMERDYQREWKNSNLNEVSDMNNEFFEPGNELELFKTLRDEEW